MLKINLEKQLIRQNRSVVTARELLLVKEYDRVGEALNSDAIKRVFGGTAAADGQQVKERVESLILDTKGFDQARVFHISQIERLCKKYHLRFLPSVRYKGSIDPQTAAKISQFEIASGRRCKGWKAADGWNGESYADGNTYIAAPAGSFKLEEIPKDPLLFFEINSEYYYLIHKWGQRYKPSQKVV